MINVVLPRGRNSAAVSGSKQLLSCHGGVMAREAAPPSSGSRRAQHQHPLGRSIRRHHAGHSGFYPARIPGVFQPDPIVPCGGEGKPPELLRRGDDRAEGIRTGRVLRATTTSPLRSLAARLRRARRSTLKRTRRRGIPP